MEAEDQIVTCVTDAIMSRLMRGEERALREIIDDEVRQLLGRIKRDAGWSEWPVKGIREAFCKLQA